MAPHATNETLDSSYGQIHAPKHTTADYGFDAVLTPSVIKATGPNADPRLREVFGNLVKHLHEFLRESKVTRTEYEAALKMVWSLTPADLVLFG